MVFPAFVYYFAMAMSLTGFTLAFLAFRTLPERPVHAQRLLCVALMVGMVSIILRLVSATSI